MLEDLNVLVLVINSVQEKAIKDVYCSNGWIFANKSIFLSKYTKKKILGDYHERNKSNTHQCKNASVKAKYCLTATPLILSDTSATSTKPDSSDYDNTKKFAHSKKWNDEQTNQVKINDTFEEHTCTSNCDDSNLLETDNLFVGDDVSASNNTFDAVFKKANCYRTSCSRSQGPLSKKRVSSSLASKHDCKDCRKTFSTRTGLFNHRKAVHQNGFCYKCDRCDKTFLYKPHFIGHMNTHNQVKPFQCELCQRSFSYKQALVLHKKNSKCMQKTNEKPNMNSASGRTKTRQKTRVLCDLCGTELSSKSALKEHHTYVHSNKPKLACKECGRLFKTDATLRRHVTVSHANGKDRKYSCDTCGLDFKQAEVLRQHKQRHNKEFSCHCETCGKGFYSQYKLKEHQRIHTGEKPFTCSICMNFKCSTKSNLLKHAKLHQKGNVPDTVAHTRQKRQRRTTNMAYHIMCPSGANLHGNDTDMQMDQITDRGMPRNVSHLATGSYCYGNQSQGHNDGLFINMTSAIEEGEIGRYENVLNSNAATYQNLVTDIPYESRGVASFYGNSNSREDISTQSLSILTTALNVVNPSQY